MISQVEMHICQMRRIYTVFLSIFEIVVHGCPDDYGINWNVFLGRFSSPYGNTTCVFKSRVYSSPPETARASLVPNRIVLNLVLGVIVVTLDCQPPSQANDANGKESFVKEEEPVALIDSLQDSLSGDKLLKEDPNESHL